MIFWEFENGLKNSHFYFLETFSFFFYLIMILDELNFALDGSNDTIKKHTKEMEVCSIV